MVDIRKRNIHLKISDMVLKSTDANNLLKPELAVQMWGPKFSDVDIPEEFDQSRNFAESQYSTYQHKKKEISISIVVIIPSSHHV